MFDYKKSIFWNDYIASLDSEKESGLGGFCEYLSQRLEAVEHTLAGGLACTHPNTINPLGRVFCPDCNNLVTQAAKA